jgi:D-alanine-D-alanine ligase
MNRKLRVGLIFGGRSGEHEVSLLSARSIFDALDRNRYEPVLLGIDRNGRWHHQDAARALLATPGTPLHLDAGAPPVTIAPGSEGSDGTLVTANTHEGVGALDVIFPVLHGTYGEDGTLQGLLEMAGLPYVGSGVLGSAAGMDKDIAKRLFRGAGIPVVDGFVLRAGDARDHTDVAREVRERFGYPCFVKPCNMGSSVGVSKARDDAQLTAALVQAFRYDTKVLIERGHEVREVEVAVLGNEHPEASVAGEIIPSHDFYSYEAKYLDEHGAALQIPAALDDTQMARVRAMAIDAFRALDLSGLARVDFFIDKRTREVFLNEVNTLPGFTRISMYPKLWEASGVSYGALVDRLITLALERHQVRRALATRYTPSTV